MNVNKIKFLLSKNITSVSFFMFGVNTHAFACRIVCTLSSDLGLYEYQYVLCNDIKLCQRN